jgi:hypothetical protein
VEIFYCVITTEKHVGRREAIAKTWGAKISRLIFFGDHNRAKDACISVSNNNTYMSGMEKTINFLNLVYLLKPTDGWLFFCDDDTFVATGNLSKYAEAADENIIHGQILTLAESFQSLESRVGLLKYPSGGAGFLVHSNSVYKHGPFDFHPIHYGDVAIGLCFENKVDFQDPGLFYGQSPTFYGKDHPRSTSCTYHYVKTESEQTLLNDFYASI